MKRWLRFHQAMNKKRWFEPDREKNGPITLFDFSTELDAVDAALVEQNSNNRSVWRTTDDSIIGGYSSAKMQLVRTSEDLKRIINGQESIPPHLWDQNRTTDQKSNEIKNDSIDGIQHDNGERGDGREHCDTENDFLPFVRWKGTIDTRVNKEKKVHRSGFCSILSPEFPMAGVDLDGRYNGLEIMCRSDGRPYSLNLKVESFIEDDLFQCFINIPPTNTPGSKVCQATGGKFDQVVFLFQHFAATAGGRLRARQRKLDNAVKIQSIGITLMDGVDGDFEFDLSRIRAVNYDENGVIGEAD
ncbi:unnamed protein product [Pseudo-nitzschia multistriata]|uniref:NADH:ubiquinone oxidoreductase intermediate-associated protein 30 domain-containing protein n=1 Tax=Pseudo-nitzschia multistriata TaxID=183589 RepID=A0A448ZDV4_9STRA|nr:unnamed protein product [Pseudo-nitzschia multistriata]